MTAIKLLRRAIGLLTHKPIKTLAVVGPALVLIVAVSILIAMVTPELLLIGSPGVDMGRLPFGLEALVMLFAFVLSYSLMAIMWHRYSLGHDNHPKHLSPTLFLGYLWRVGILALIQITVSLAVIVPLVLASHNAGGGVRPAIPSILIATFVSQLLLIWLSLRLSLILPAAAIGRPIKMKDSWDCTTPIAHPLWGVAAALALLNTIIRALVAFLGLQSPVYIVALELPIYILKGLLVLSILTTLYTSQIQKRT
jgi:hypothetical protein